MAQSRPNPRSRGRRRTGSGRNGRPSTRSSASTGSLTNLGTPGGPVDTDASFATLGVPPVVVDALARAGIDRPFPIQAATLPDSIAGRDVLGRGRTGSGKTLAFVLPIVARLAGGDGNRRGGRRPRALVLAPTRELVAQIDDTIRPLAAATGLRSVTVFGGVSQGRQAESFRRGVDIVVACPGRLEDLIGQGLVSLDAVEITVLDEADHMADLGFLPGVTRLLDRTPSGGQRLLFSATLDAGVEGLVRRFLSNPIVHSVESAPVEMDHHVLRVRADDRLPVLADLASAPGRTMVFTRTKHRAKALTRQLVKLGVPAVEMHGNLAQNARIRNLAAFSDGRATAMVATDIAARGIHVDDIALVVHADPPVEHKAYVHRSGRTARAGAAGTVVTLATPDQRTEVDALTKKAGVVPEVSEARVGDPILEQLAPGRRLRLSADELADVLPTAPVSQPQRQRTTPAGSGSSRSARSGAPRAGSPGGGPRPARKGGSGPSASPGRRTAGGRARRRRSG